MRVACIVVWSAAGGGEEEYTTELVKTREHRFGLLSFASWEHSHINGNFVESMKKD